MKLFKGREGEFYKLFIDFGIAPLLLRTRDLLKVGLKNQMVYWMSNSIEHGNMGQKLCTYREGHAVFVCGVRSFAIGVLLERSIRLSIGCPDSMVAHHESS